MKDSSVSSLPRTLPRARGTPIRPLTSSMPILAGGWSALAQLGPGWSTCALDRQQAAWCWGLLVAPGGSREGFATPQAVPGNFIWSQVAVGGSVACGVVASGGPAGEIYCWGDNSESTGGLLGSGVEANYSLTPVPRLMGVGPWQEVSVGSDSACGLLSGNGLIMCW
jgi:hypothetical protein